jgi:hypothetical protein
LVETHTRFMQIHKQLVSRLELGNGNRIAHPISPPLATSYLVAVPMDAGARLTTSYDLLEMILLELPSFTLLFAKRVSRFFRFVITTSKKIQAKLFLVSSPDTLDPAATIVNTLITQPTILASLPIWFDPQERRLAYCHRTGRQRVYCRAVTVQVEEEGGVPFLRMELTHNIMLDAHEDWKTRVLQAGSWKEMYLSQPCRRLEWYIIRKPDAAFGMSRASRRNTERREDESYYGIVHGKRNLDSLLDGLAESTVIASQA